MFCPSLSPMKKTTYTVAVLALMASVTLPAEDSERVVTRGFNPVFSLDGKHGDLVHGAFAL